MTTPNSIIADLSHEIDRLQKISNRLLEVAIRAEEFIRESQEYSTTKEAFLLAYDLRYAIDEAHHG
jgi:division protein CdvB (Snf7/Vps24/ESCRT-III family)